ncbi:hypothetical protein [Parvularcula sp. LCG005]|uniref:hypothetical protein n=1 Tax=Parvularcula sp. LCG005 TaxID=3078805 RepID=UPI002943067D|nr:hypothetical protein [Parvularcula sp. LCG005]WOI54292.1 hypothetical protein RUI03_04650 [Parvularcula sp. LCG005]
MDNEAIILTAIADPIQRSGSPQGVLTPLSIFQQCLDTTTGRLFTARGATSADWVEQDLREQFLRIETNVTTAYTLGYNSPKIIEIANNAAAFTLTLPADATANFGDGRIFDIWSATTQTVTIQAGAGASLFNVAGGSCTMDGQWSRVTVMSRYDNLWAIHGDHGAVS